MKDTISKLRKRKTPITAEEREIGREASRYSFSSKADMEKYIRRRLEGQSVQDALKGRGAKWTGNWHKPKGK